MKVFVAKDLENDKMPTQTTSFLEINLPEGKSLDNLLETFANNFDSYFPHIVLFKDLKKEKKGSQKDKHLHNYYSKLKKKIFTSHKDKIKILRASLIKEFMKTEETLSIFEPLKDIIGSKFQQ